MTASRPLQVGVSELLRSPGSRRPFTAEVELSGLETSVANVPEGATVRVELTLESLSSSVAATGTVGVSWEGRCRRCLGQVAGEVETDLREIFEAHPVEGETYGLAGESIDLEPMLRDAVLLALPLAPLCRPECPGPDPDRFPAGTATGVEALTDPRWTALDGLRFDPPAGAEVGADAHQHPPSQRS